MHIALFFSSPPPCPRSFISMPEDTQEIDSSPYKAAILALLRMADERMLQDSANPVYLRLKEELDQLR